MVDLKSDPKTATLVSPFPATQLGTDPNADLSKLKPPNLIDLGVDRMLEGPAALPNLHSAKSVKAKFGKCTIGSVEMTLAIGEKV
ncbi:MAG: hypothetical protein NTV65_04135 [Proteobacteria bacterium]|nr:hypothetical protein [Pseudomonadota bacterium]